MRRFAFWFTAAAAMWLAASRPAGAAEPEAAAPTTARPPVPPEVKKTVDAFLGNWSFDATVSLNGGAPAKCKMSFACKKAARGAGVACTSTAKVPGLGPWEGSFLIAHDPLGGRTHFMSVTTAGEVHDHQCTWRTETELSCDPLKAGPTIDEMSISWKDAKTATFRSVTKAPEGTTVFEGTGKRASTPK